MPSPLFASIRRIDRSILVAVLILGTLMFDYTTVQPNDPGILATIWDSLTLSKGKPMPVILYNSPNDFSQTNVTRK